MLAAPIIAQTDIFTMCNVYSFSAFLYIYKRVHAESVEQFIEAHAFVLAYDLAPCPPLLPFSVSKLDQQDIGRLRKI